MAIGDSSIGLLFRIKSDPTQAVQGLKQTSQEVNKLDKTTQDFGHTASGVGDVLAGTFIGGLAVGAVTTFVSELTNATKAVFDYSARMEQTKIGFATLLGGMDAAEKHIKELKTFAETTPFEFEGLANMSRRLQNAGVEAQKVLPLMTDIGNAAAAVGASSDEINSISLAFSQIIAKGKVSAEEVNQLAERGIPIWEILSKTLGRTKGEIIDLAEKGKISSDLFLSAFHKFSELNFGDAMEKQSHTFNGAISTIKDIMLDAAATGFQPIFDKIASFTDQVAVSLSKQKKAAGDAGLSYGEIVGTFIGVGMKNASEQTLNDWNDKDKWWIKVGKVAAAPGGWAAEWGRMVGRGAAEGFKESWRDYFEQNGKTFLLDPNTNTVQPKDPGPKQPGPITIQGQGMTDKELKAFSEKLEAENRERLGKLKEFYRATIEEAQQAYEITQGLTEERYKKEEITAQEFLAQSKRNINAYFEFTTKKNNESAKIDEEMAKTSVEKDTAALQHKMANIATKKEAVKNLAAVVELIDQEEEKRAEKRKKQEEEEIQQIEKLIQNWEELGQTVTGWLDKIDADMQKWATLNEEANALVRENIDINRELEDLNANAQKKALERAAKGSHGEARKNILAELERLDTEAANRAAARRKFDIDEEEKAALARIKGKDNEEYQKVLIQDLYDKKRLLSEDEFQQELAEIKANYADDEYDPFRSLRESWTEFTDLIYSSAPTLQESLEAIGGIGVDAFQSMASAIGNLVQQWVLYGETGPASLKKILAATLATIAAEAAVRAIFEAAMALATLFLNPAESAGHAGAAILFAGIAGVAALAGRALAGDSFKQKTGAANASASSSSSSSSRNNSGEGQGEAYSSYGNKAYVEEEGRNAPLGVSVEISFKDKPDWFDDMFEARWAANGKPRRIVEDGR